MSFGAPASPDYAGAANQQYQSGVQATQAQTAANRPNQSNPWANLSWNQDPTTGSWSQAVTLNPEEQAALTSQQGMQAGRSATAAGLQGQVDSNLASPMDWGKFDPYTGANAARDQAITGAYNQAASRLDPRFSQAQEGLNAQLASQGLDPTSEAAQTAQGNLGRERNDAYSSAMNGAISQGTAAGNSIFQNSLQGRQEQIGESLQQRYQPLNEQNMLTAGQGVQGPTFQGFNQAGAWGPMQALAAAGLQGQYQLGANGQSNAMWGDIFNGLGQLGGSAMKMGGSAGAAAV